MQNLINIEPLRRQINITDKKIIALIGERLRIAKKIGQLKKTNGLPITNRKREAEVIAIAFKNGKPFCLKETFVTKLFKLIISESKKVQKETNEK